jgi:hypothetical protein
MNIDLYICGVKYSKHSKELLESRRTMKFSKEVRTRKSLHSHYPEWKYFVTYGIDGRVLK